MSQGRAGPLGTEYLASEVQTCKQLLPVTLPLGQAPLGFLLLPLPLTLFLPQVLLQPAHLLLQAILLPLRFLQLGPKRPNKLRESPYVLTEACQVFALLFCPVAHGGSW